MSVKALDKLGEAIVDAGYDWTYDMRKAYEDGIKQSQWKGLTLDEMHQLNDALNLQGRFSIIETIEAKLKEKNT